MRLCTLDFIIREAGTNIRRNMLMSLACVTTVAVTMGFSGFVVLGFRNAEYLLHHLAQELVLAAYIRTDVSPGQRDEVGEEIAAMPHVQGIPVLVSKAHAWKEFSATIPDSLKGEVNGNPLPDTFMIRADSPAHVPLLARRIEALPEVDKVNAPVQEAVRAGAILRFARLATSTVTLLLLGITTLLVMNTIRLTLYARRHEIRVMQLVGATNGYIRTPFILEGLTLGLVGAALACGLIAVGYPYVIHLVQKALAFDLPLLQPGREMLQFYEQVLGIGAAVGAFGSLVSVGRFLRPVEFQVPVRRLRPRELKHMVEQREVDARIREASCEQDSSTVPTINYPGREHADFPLRSAEASSLMDTSPPQSDYGHEAAPTADALLEGLDSHRIQHDWLPLPDPDFAEEVVAQERDSETRASETRDPEACQAVHPETLPSSRAPGAPDEMDPDVVEI